MAVTRVAGWSFAGNATVTTQSITSPACSVGDLLVAFVINKALSNVISAPDSTWTEIYQWPADCTTAADDHRAAIFRKIATASWASFTFSKVTDDNVLFWWVIGVWTGHDPNTPIDLTGAISQVNVAGSDNITFPAYNPNWLDSHIVFAGFYGNDLTTMNAAMSSDTNPDCTTRIDVETSTGNDCTISVTSWDTTDGSNIASRTWATASSVDAGSTWVVFGIKTKAPTVTLNSPADASTDPDTTPTFDFTGTDAESNDIRYQFMLDDTSDTVARWLEMYWKLDESSGTAVDEIRWWNDGTASTASWTTGKINNWYSFDGSSKSISMTTWASSILSSKAWSISYWMNKAGNPASVFWAIIACDNSTWQRQFAMGINTSWQFYFERYGTQVVSSGTTFSNSTWYHIVVTYDGSNLKSYVNGNSTADTTTAMVNLPSSANILTFGKRQYSGSEKYYNGILDEVGIWSRVISTTEISTLYNAGSGAAYSTLLPILEKVSNVDSGFANPDVGWDTDPFTSGDNIQFTVQAGDSLSNGTYYWRVRGFDPSGSNSYWEWSSSRSFTVWAASSTWVPWSLMLMWMWI